MKEMKESPRTAGWVLGVVIGCKSMLKRLPTDGGWLLTEVGWLTHGGFPYAAERLLGGVALVLECLDVVGDGWCAGAQ
jgi:hypothetical protein